MRSVADVTYGALVRLAGSRSGAGVALWERLWDPTWRHLSGPVRTTIHGHEVTVNAGYSYPAFSRRWPTYNQPLVEVVHQAHLAKGAPVTVIDVGAAVGDTVLLILERCPGAVRAVHCVEGDDEFYGYLTANLADVPQARLHRAMLSDGDVEAAALVRTHLGTASAQGSGRVAAVTLDSVMADAGWPEVDVLKVDTDGYDGKVLGGAGRLLGERRPAVIFEWHPLLYDATGQDRRRPFQILAAAGYRWFVWFDKYGVFSHVDDGYRQAQVDVLAELCVSGRGPGPDWHYDVVALPEERAIDPAEMAALTFARSSRPLR